MNVEEAILEKIRRLSAAKQQEVLRFADGLQHPPAVRMVPSRDRSLDEIGWLEKHRAGYAAQWESSKVID